MPFRSNDQLPVKLTCEDIAPMTTGADTPEPTVSGDKIPVPVLTVPIYPCEDAKMTRQANNNVVVDIFTSAIFANPQSENRSKRLIM